MKRAIIFTLMVLLWASRLEAVTYYVGQAAGGGGDSDARSCASARNDIDGSRKRNIGLSGSSGLGCLGPGDTLIIRQGTYTDSIQGQSLAPTQPAIPAGTSESARTIIMAAPGETVTINQPAGHTFVIWVGNTSWVTIQGLHLVGRGTLDAYDVAGADNSDHVRFANNEISNGGYNCLSLYGSDHHVLNNNIHNCGMHHPGTGNPTGHSIYSRSDRALVEFNYIHDSVTPPGASNGPWGFHQFDHSPGAIMTGTIVRWNHFKNLVEGLFIGYANSGEVYQNVIELTANSAISTGATNSNTKIWSNTIYGSGAYCIRVRPGENSGVIISNNICFNNFTNAPDFNPGEATLVSSYTANPNFVAAGPGRFDLLGTSTAICAAPFPAVSGDISQTNCSNTALVDYGVFRTARLPAGGCVAGAPNANTIRCTWVNNDAPPLQVSSTTGFIATKGGANNPVTAVVANGNVLDITVTNPYLTTDTCAVSYTPGNLRDTANIGGVYSSLFQQVNAFSSFPCGVTSGYALIQTHSQFYALRNDGSTIVPKGAADGNTTVQPNGSIRLRLKVSCTLLDCPAITPFVYYSRNGAGYSIMQDTPDINHIGLEGGIDADTQIPSGTIGSELLTSDFATNFSGRYVRVSNDVSAIDLSLNSETEMEYLFSITGGAVGDTYDFRIYDALNPLNAYPVTPRLTVVNPQLEVTGF